MIPFIGQLLAQTARLLPGKVPGEFIVECNKCDSATFVIVLEGPEGPIKGFRCAKCRHLHEP